MMSKSAPCSPVKVDPFHIVHKVPVGDSPYVKAKHVQLVDRDPVRAIALFWAAINSGDRVDSALKDMAIVMKQQNRAQEAIEAIKSLRGRCSDQAQESLDNVLLDLYKRCGRVEDQIDLLKHKLHLIHQGMAFNGKRTKTARSQGKKFQVSVEQEATRLLGNLGWAYMQQTNYAAAEAVYRKALSIESDNNKVCNLGICLMKQGRLEEAKAMLETVTKDGRWMSDSHIKSFERAQEMLESMSDIERKLSSFTIEQPRRVLELGNIDPAMKDAFLATSGFGPESLFQSESWPGSSGSDDLDYSSPDESSEGLDRRRTLPPLQQEPMSTWNMMDFTFNPSNLDLGSPPTESPSMRASEGLTSEIEMRQQRRLRVFQEMTLPKTLQV